VDCRGGVKILGLSSLIFEMEAFVLVGLWGVKGEEKLGIGCPLFGQPENSGSIELGFAVAGGLCERSDY